MKQIEQSPNTQRWPRMRVTAVKCRDADLLIRITDWSKDEDEPGYDVECYIGGVYDFNESKCCTVHKYKTLAAAKEAAIAFAKAQVEKLL